MAPRKIEILSINESTGKSTSHIHTREKGHYKNMATGRDLCIFFFPFLTTVATLVLTCLVFVGCYKDVPVVKDIYFMSLNFTNIDVSSVAGAAGASRAESAAINSIINKIGISNVYNTGANGYCKATENGTVVDCYHPTTPYWFDLPKILEEDSNIGITITLPEDIQNYEKTLKGASYAMWVCYIIGLGLTAIELFIGFFAFHSRMASFCSCLFAGLGCIFLVVASAIATGIYLVYKHAFNDNLSSFGVTASLGTKAYVLTWVAAAASFVSAVWWMFSICCGSTRHNRTREEEKEPFIGYVPDHGY